MTILNSPQIMPYLLPATGVDPSCCPGPPHSSLRRAPRGQVCVSPFLCLTALPGLRELCSLMAPGHTWLPLQSLSTGAWLLDLWPYQAPRSP